MKSMKKMLCLLLVAMLLVAAIPVAASASEYDATTVNYSVVFAVKDTSTNNVKYSSVIAVAAVSSDANDDAIRAAAASAAASAGFTVVTKDAIADRVAANGNADIVHNVIYGEIRTKIDTDNKQFKYVLEVTPRPSVETADVIRHAKIYIDKEGTGTFVDTGKTVDVTLVETKTNDTTTYALKSNGGASVVDIQGKLGANYANKQLSIRMECPTGSDQVAYYVTVTGTNGSTGTNVPSTNGNSGNNGVPGASGSTNGNNNTTGTIPNGNGSSSNGGSSSNNGGTGTVAQFKVTFLNVNGIEFYSEYVTANNTITASADFLNSSVGTKAGYEHIGWKPNSGSTKTTNVVLTDKINANVTYAPVFKSLADNRVVIPGGGSSTTSNGNSSSSGTTTNKFPYPVYLNIYKDTLVGSPDKRVEITNGIALDGLVSLEEAKTVVKNYYTAKDSDGISYDGLYIAEGNWVADYVADTAKYNSIDAGSMRQTGTVYINVMIGNAKAKTSATADASNPKTGDTIFVPFMVMGVTATALAAAYVFGKKRIAR